MFSWLKKVLSERASSSPKSTLQLRVETPIERSLEIAQELAKPCVLLKREGDKLAAVWGGRGTVSGPEGYRHWLSVDCSFLPTDVGLRKGVISIYSGGEDWDSGVVEYESNTTLSLNEGIPLYAHNALSMPPPDAHDDLDTDAYIKNGWIIVRSIWRLQQRSSEDGTFLGQMAIGKNFVKRRSFFGQLRAPSHGLRFGRTGKRFAYVSGPHENKFERNPRQKTVS